jgi:hypothetical protein
MTPEERAEDVVKRWQFTPSPLDEGPFNQLRGMIAAAIREAERPAEAEKVKTRGEVVADKLVTQSGNSLIFHGDGTGCVGLENFDPDAAPYIVLMIAAAIDAEIAAERESCIEIALKYTGPLCGSTGRFIADEIRNRRNFDAPVTDEQRRQRGLSK